MGGKVSRELFLVWPLLASFRFADERSYALKFAKKSFTVSTVATFYSIPAGHVDRAFNAVKFYNKNFSSARFSF